MSSILTNTSAMVALQTLRGINQNLGQTQAEISSGKSIASARDNAAVWAISKVMESDVNGFKQISNSLALGQSTIAVARGAAETVTDLLTDIKGLVVAAQEPNVDRTKIAQDVTRLTEQITSVINSAQFNGLNLVDGSTTGASILGSLDRDAAGNVTANSINVTAQNLSTDAGTALTGQGAATIPATLTASDGTGGSGTDYLALDTFAFLDASGGATGTAALAANTAGADTAVTTGLIAGDRVALTIGAVQGVYTVREGDTEDAIAVGLRNAMVDAGLDTTSYSLSLASGELRIENATNADVAIAFSTARSSGALGELASMTTALTGSNPSTALGQIESMIQSAITASASFGSAERRIDIQADFVSKLTDSLKSGIGTLVDADMEEASARLQALQVQQQLAIQSLSIANQSPQSILALFR